MKRNSNFFKKGLEVDDIKSHIVKSFVEDIEQCAKNISEELPKKIFESIEKEK